MLILSLTAFGFTAQGADAAPPKARLPSVTIEAAREHALRLKVDQFVTSVVVQPSDDALYRWNRPICPLVAGLTKAQGEFVLARISKAAIDAHAPLAGRVCSPNLFVVVIGNPDLLLKKWWERDREMYNTQFGVGAIEDFIHSTRPIRVWYDTYTACEGGGKSLPSTIVIDNYALPTFAPPGCSPYHDLGTRLTPLMTRSNISAMIVVVDGRQMKNITIGQLADYVALVGLADVRLEADSTPVSSILELFGHGTPPQGLTRWDRALLYSLYNTDQMTNANVQVPEIEITMVRRIAP
jgi:hypothetical protein